MSDEYDEFADFDDDAWRRWTSTSPRWCGRTSSTSRPSRPPSRPRATAAWPCTARTAPRSTTTRGICCAGTSTLLLETGETPVHEPAFAPEPDKYIPWEYARGYVDALQDVGVDQRRAVEECPRCQFTLPEPLVHANFCPRCSMPLLGPRLAQALLERGMDETEVAAILHEMGLPG